MSGCFGASAEDRYRERELHHYLDDCDADARHEAEAEERTRESIAEARAECLTNDEKLGDALAEWFDDERKYVRLALAMQAATGEHRNTTALQEIIDEAARGWAADNAKTYTADDVAQSERNAAEDDYPENEE